MRYLALIGLSLVFTGLCSAQCSGTLRDHRDLEWSEPARVISPDRLWVVKVRPVLDQAENRTPVTIGKCGDSTSWPLFSLQRSATLYWSSDSKHVFVVNQPFSGTDTLLFFSVPLASAGAGASASVIDETVKQAIRERLGKDKRIQFYLINVIFWKHGSLLLAVGGQSYVENVGPLDTYCYGVLINSDTLTIQEVLTKKELKERYGRSCQLSP